MSIVGCNIKKLRLFLGMSQAEFANQIRTSAVSVSSWENGKKEPSIMAIITISMKFKISSDWLLGTHNSASVLSPEELELIRSYRRLDDFGKRAVHSICEVEFERVDHDVTPIIEIPHRQIPLYVVSPAAGFNGLSDGDEHDMIDVDDSVPGNADFAVKISGDSMEPYINDGEVVYVQRRHELSNGEVGIFSVDGAMYCKQFYIDRSGTLNLLSANPERADSSIIVKPDSSSTVVVYGRVLLDRKPPLPY